MSVGVVNPKWRETMHNARAAQNEAAKAGRIHVYQCSSCLHTIRLHQPLRKPGAHQGCRGKFWPIG